MVTAAASDLYVNEVLAAAPGDANPEWGGRTWGPDRAVACLVAEQSKIIRQADGSEAVSSTQVYAAPADADVLIPGARVTLPAGPAHPDGLVTYVIQLDAVIVGDPAVDGVTAMCE